MRAKSPPSRAPPPWAGPVTRTAPYVAVSVTPEPAARYCLFG
uniref:Uncharacterized protein n=1 Tax=Setaria viridis TaxID=4556 RepID=A0A4U6VP06_SETVI|nr:hypothetical protein SEVIR_2G050166v2 [Setaria viridis]